MALNIWFAAVAAIYSSVLTAHDRFDIARSIDLGVLLVRTASTIYALHVGWGLWGLAGAMVLGNLFALMANRFFAGSIFSGLRSFPLLFSRNRMKELFGYGFYAFISSITVKIIGQSDLVIVGAFLSVAAVREYSVGAMLVFYSAPFLSLIGNTFFPIVQRKVSGGRWRKLGGFFSDKYEFLFALVCLPISVWHFIHSISLIYGCCKMVSVIALC